MKKRHQIIRPKILLLKYSCRVHQKKTILEDLRPFIQLPLRVKNRTHSFTFKRNIKMIMGRLSCLVLVFIFFSCNQTNQKTIYIDNYRVVGNISADTIYNGNVKFYDRLNGI